MVEALQTRRLLLHPLQLEDAPHLQKLFSCWEVVRFLDGRVPWPYPENGAVSYFRDTALPGMRTGTQWHWTLRRKEEPNQRIGAISLMQGEDNRGFWMGVPWQRQGFMSEAADVVTDYWFNILKFPVMRISKAALNTASRRISEKQDMRLVGSIEKEYVCGLLRAEIWEITAEEWNTRSGRRTQESSPEHASNFSVL